jgi:hypothetical protein
MVLVAGFKLVTSQAGDSEIKTAEHRFLGCMGTTA